MDVESGAGTEDMALEGSERDEVEDAFVAGFENHGRSATGVEGFLPAKCAEAPSIARLQPGELVLGPRCGEVVAGIPAEGEELRCHLRAHDMAAHVVGIGTAVAIAEEPSDGREAAGFEAFAEYVPCGIG